MSRQSRFPPGQSTEEALDFIAGLRDYAIFILDPDGRIKTWNEGARQMKGYDSREILGQSFTRFYPPEDVAAEKPQKLLQTALERGRAEDEGWRVHKNGSRF